MTHAVNPTNWLLLALLIGGCTESGRPEQAPGSDAQAPAAQVPAARTPDVADSVPAADASAPVTPKVPDSLEEKVTRLILALPEYQRANRYLDSLTNHQHGATLMLEAPSDEQPYYLVRMGYNGPERFETYSLFEVDPTTYEIRIQDPVRGEALPLAEWRQERADSATGTRR